MAQASGDAPARSPNTSLTTSRARSETGGGEARSEGADRAALSVVLTADEARAAALLASDAGTVLLCVPTAREALEASLAAGQPPFAALEAWSARTRALLDRFRRTRGRLFLLRRPDLVGHRAVRRGSRPRHCRQRFRAAHPRQCARRPQGCPAR